MVRLIVVDDDMGYRRIELALQSLELTPRKTARRSPTCMVDYSEVRPYRVALVICYPPAG
jgi:hypothetical protein